MPQDKSDAPAFRNCPTCGEPEPVDAAGCPGCCYQYGRYGRCGDPVGSGYDDYGIAGGEGTVVAEYRPPISRIPLPPQLARETPLPTLPARARTCVRCRFEIVPESAAFCPHCGHDRRIGGSFSPPAPPPPVLGPSSPVPPSYYSGAAGSGIPAGGGQLYYVPPPRHIDPNTVQMTPGKHSPAMAVICSLLLTGLGQMVNKQTNKGIVILVSCIVAALATFGIGGFVVAVLATIDAGMIAGRLNRGEAVGQWQWF